MPGSKRATGAQGAPLARSVSWGAARVVPARLAVQATLHQTAHLLLAHVVPQWCRACASIETERHLLPAAHGGHGRTSALCWRLHAQLVKDGGRARTIGHDRGDLVCAPRYGGWKRYREMLARGRN